VTIVAPHLRQRSHSASFPSLPNSSGIPLQPLRKRRSSTADRFYSPIAREELEPPVYPPRPRRRNRYRGRSTWKKMPFLEAHYHPFLFAMMMLSGIAELGLTSFLISAGNESGTWPSARYHSLLIMFCFNAAWTTLFSTTYMLWYVDGASHFLANVASSVIWLVVTSALWGIAAGIMHNTRTGGSCLRKDIISRCRQSLTVEALGWTEFGLCTLTMIVTCLWMLSIRRRNKIETDSTNGSEKLV